MTFSLVGSLCAFIRDLWRLRLLLLQYALTFTVNHYPWGNLFRQKVDRQRLHQNHTIPMAVRPWKQNSKDSCTQKPSWILPSYKIKPSIPTVYHIINISLAFANETHIKSTNFTFLKLFEWLNALLQLSSCQQRVKSTIIRITFKATETYHELYSFECTLWNFLPTFWMEAYQFSADKRKTYVQNTLCNINEILEHCAY